MKSFSLWPSVIALSAVLAGALAFMNVSAQARMVLVLWFLLVCPGMMLVRFFDLREPLAEWTLAVVLSLVIDTLVAGLLLAAGRWSPLGALAILLGLTLAGALAQEVNIFLIWRKTR